MVRTIFKDSFVGKIPYFIFFLVIALIVVFSFLSQPDIIEKGKSDLGNWDFRYDGVIFLNGEWEF